MADNAGHNPDTAGPMLTQQLLLTVIEQLKLPLLQIGRRAELAGIAMQPDYLEDIRITAEAALQLLDNYLLGVQLAGQRGSLFEVEPVSVAAVLHDAGDQLRPLAKAYGVTLDLQIDGRYGPVMAHRQGLQAALVSVGYALVEALPAQDTPQLRLRLSAHRCRYGIVAGLYCDMGQLTAQALRLGRCLQGRARQPLQTWSHTSAAGVFVADAILRAMRARLTASRHRHMYGLGTVLPLNPQLQLI
jgi:hypothetical protein